VISLREGIFSRPSASLLRFCRLFRADLADAQLTDEHIARIIETYQKRPAKPIERYARRVGMKEIEANDFNLNISRYVSTAEAEEEIDLASTHAELVTIDKSIQKATAKHNQFLKELGLLPLP
jgi:type I restriction enzyme M protein